MPQLEFATYSSQIFWLVSCLGILYFSLRYFFIPRLETALQLRHAKINKLLVDTQAVHEETAKLQASYEKTIKEANVAAAQLQQQQLDKFKQDCEQQLNELKTDQQLELKKAEEEIKKIKKKFASAMPAEIEKLLQTFISKLENGKEDK